jgi:hypothetical protein
MDSMYAGMALVCGGTFVSVFGVWLVRRRMPIDRLNEFHEVAGYLLSVVGTLYAVLLGLVVVDAMSRFQAAQVTVANEANSLADMFLMAGGLPSEKQKSIRLLLENYTDDVVLNEWPAMDNGTYSQESRKLVSKLWTEMVHYEPQTENQKAVYAVLLSEMAEFADSRRERLIAAKHGVSHIMWIVLFVGAFFTVGFTYFFGLNSIRAQMLMTGVVAMSIALNLLLVSIFGYPFSGDIRVHPDEFRLDKLIFKEALGIRDEAGEKEFDESD